MNNSVLGFSQRSNWAIFTLVQRFIPILAFALVVGACASAPTDSAPDAGAVATTVAGTPGTTTGSNTTEGSGATSAPTTAATDGAPAATTAPAAATTTDFDGVAAPDFRLALADGSDFVLSEESKPVYMIFWAEW